MTRQRQSHLAELYVNEGFDDSDHGDKPTNCGGRIYMSNDCQIDAKFETKMEMVPYKYLKLSYLTLFKK
mgnify:CR=1 FL=1